MGDDGQYEDPAATQVEAPQQVQQPQEQPPGDQTAGDQSGGHGANDPNAPSQYESQFAQAGQLYENGQYQAAITLMQDLADNGSQNDKGRALYGIVMCYDMMGQLRKADYGDSSAEAKMETLMAFVGATHPAYMQQLQTYQRGQRWTGEYLLY